MVRMELTVLSKGNVLPGNLRENENRQLCVQAGGRGNCRGGTLSTKLILLNYLNLSMNIKSLRTSQESWLHITCSISMKCAKSAKPLRQKAELGCQEL